MSPRGVRVAGVPSGEELAQSIRAGRSVADLAEQYDCMPHTISGRVNNDGYSATTGDPLGLLFDPRPWTEDALCATTDPEAFFPEKGGSTREAKNICYHCPVRAECLEDALTHQERFGIWGGLSERERRKLAKTA